MMMTPTITSTMTKKTSTTTWYSFGITWYGRYQIITVVGYGILGVALYNNRYVPDHFQ